jgi:hypothetical protein
MFYRIEFGTVRWLRKQAYILRDFQILGIVPACLIDLHDDKELTKITGHFFKKNIHHLSIGPGKYKGGHFRQSRTHRSVNIEIFPNYLLGNFRAYSFRSPATQEFTYSAKSTLILRDIRHRPFVLRITIC